jgi:endogenous inhibitor of DNA gyrase (YacG/DUF329 family)
MGAGHECAGADRAKPNTPEEVDCPHCGEEMEVWTRDKMAKCPGCSKEVTREEWQAGSK